MSKADDVAVSKGSAASPPHVPSIQNLRSWLPLYVQKADRTVEQLSRMLSTPAGTDTLLLTICYTSRLSAAVLSSISLHRLHQAAREFVDKAVSLPPNTAVIIDTSNIPPSRLLITATRLKALSTLISDFRTFTRLWGLIGIYKWGKSTLQSPPEDVVLRQIAYMQVISNIFFQYFENGAYLSSKGVLGWSPEKQGRAWRYSSRFWMTHVTLNFVRLYRETVLRANRGTTEQKRTDGPKGDVITDRDEVEWLARWRKDMVSNFAWAPLTVHWSLESGLVSEFWVGLLGSVAGVAGLRVLLKNTSQA
jgi:Peroxisomal biogenesis factor 11 (PEX11)